MRSYYTDYTFIDFTGDVLYCDAYQYLDMKSPPPVDMRPQSYCTALRVERRVWRGLRGNRVDGLTFTESLWKQFVVASLRWGGDQLKRRDEAGGDGVSKTGGCSKSIRWICEVGKSRGVETGGGHGARRTDGVLTPSLQRESRGPCQKINR